MTTQNQKIQAPRFSDIQVGDKIPALTLPAVTRKTLALYAGASADHNPLHIDLDSAREAGWPDVFAHGMLSAAYLGRMLAAWVPQKAVRSLSVRFSSITQLQDSPICSGEVVEKLEQDGETRVRVAVQCTNQNGEKKLVGEAIVALA